MERNNREQHRDVAPAAVEERESPTIVRLMEQLDRDLEETQRNASKAR